MRDQSGLDLGRRDAMPRDVHHVVDAPEQPVVALLVTLAAVAGEVAPGEWGPVGLLVALRILVDPAGHRRPGALQDEVPTPPQRHGMTRVVHDVRLDPGEWERGGARLQG